jgi:fatty aldehyde-generating acyl-ACP reductase
MEMPVMLPYLTSQAPWFVFLVHPRDAQDLHGWAGASVIAQHSASEAEFLEKICALPPTVIGDVRFGLGPAWGELISIARLPRGLLSAEGRQGIADAVRLAAQRGTGVVGLGALTAPVTHGGMDLLPGLPKGITLTTGNALTAAIARRNVVDVSEALQLGGSARVAIVGCHGSVGTAASRLLSGMGFELILIGRRIGKVEQLLGDVARGHTVSQSLADVGLADVTVLLTSDPAALVTPGMPRPGSVVIDLAHPVNVDPARYPEFERRDVSVAQGGLVQIPGYHCSVDFRLPVRHASLACLAETYLFAREGIREHSVGPASAELADELELIAGRHGVRPLPLRLPCAVTAG